uniref:G-protein coupled receptors family 1 profile domain-containing protein n=1 Tax=Plectus sambesii TaxID=2011161 RepID=A0A914XJ22_9BILA
MANHFFAADPYYGAPSGDAIMNESCRNFTPTDWLRAEGERCLKFKRGSYYDGCQQKCERHYQITALMYHINLESFVYGTVFPILISLVVVANVFVVIVLSNRHMITPTNVVLKYMAIADLCVGLVPLPWTFYFHTMKNYEDLSNLQLWWCHMNKYSMDAIPPVCHNVAMWLTVLLAGQRYISIEYPVMSRSWCRVRNVRLATVAITVMSLLCGLPKSFDYHWKVFDGWALVVQPSPTGGVSFRWIALRTCVARLTPLVESIGPNAFFNTYFWTRVLGFVILPSVLLIVLNVLLIRGIRRAQKRRRRLLREKRQREAQRQNESNTTSLMLVVIVTIFLIVNLPQAVFMGLLCVNNTFGLMMKLFEGVFPVAYLLTNNMLVMATYPINFAIYCSMSSQFRETFKSLFCRTIAHNWITQTTMTTRFGGRSSIRRSDASIPLSGKTSKTDSEAPTATEGLLTRSQNGDVPRRYNGKPRLSASQSDSLLVELKRLADGKVETQIFPAESVQLVQQHDTHDNYDNVDNFENDDDDDNTNSTVYL